MFLVEYKQEGETVIANVSKDEKDLLNVRSHTHTFLNRHQAKAFYMTTQVLESAVKDIYNAPIALTVSDKVLHVTTKTPIPTLTKQVMAKRIQETLDLLTIATAFEFHVLND